MGKMEEDISHFKMMMSIYSLIHNHILKEQEERRKKEMLVHTKEDLGDFPSQKKKNKTTWVIVVKRLTIQRAWRRDYKSQPRRTTNSV